jgi:hypothetical protein
MKKILKHLKENWIRHGFETLAVLLGVLAAFALNDWNEQRKDKQKEIELLSELRENLEEDINIISRTIELENSRISSIEKLIQHFESKLPFHDSLKSYIGRSSYLERFEINKSAYETLKSTGFEKLSSPFLKKEITYYYDVEVNHRSDIVNRLNEEQREAIVQYRRNIWKTYDDEFEKFFFNAAYQDRFIVNYLNGRVSWKRNFINDICIPNVKQAENLVVNIEEELTRLGG